MNHLNIHIDIAYKLYYVYEYIYRFVLINRSHTIHVLFTHDYTYTYYI